MVVAFGISLVVTFIALPFVYRLLRTRQILDIPNQRSSHSVPTPRGAGMAIIIGTIAAVAVRDDLPFAIYIPLLGLGFLGLLDDARPQSSIFRLSMQIILGILGALMLIISSAPQQEFSSRAIALILVGGALVIPFTVNIFNFMDGINGISAIHGILLGVTYALILESVNQSNWAIFGWALTGSSIAFLPWNWGSHGRLFLGDSGSYFIGVLIGCSMIACYFYGVELILVMLPFSIYVVDVAQALVRRAVAREKFGIAHRDHIYQILVDRQHPHSTVSITVGIFTLAECFLTICAVNNLISIPLTSGIGLILIVGYLVIPQLYSGKIKSDR